ncbi:hypothetical protein DVA67_033335 [Solirubrobacter sp. CPCC 204708]|uniref:Uncharacterized protein n=1 Tax=Solirubrobacter deserti TaxID=2282478 RepID=A0ABT4RIX6_9ACTN|nr:hypothetical protein [Solirubrobacter deserti]MBE2320889.1 hypothetical protein [Solirubrobacter deserti]MDA0138524.1 hypothetical protein [Solirubrobacter deserti]
MNDVTDRLRAANPVKEEPALPPVAPLLARLDDAPAPRRPRRRLLLVLALVMTVLAAIVVGLELRGPDVDVVAEARAALGGTDAIVHVVARDERFNPDGTLVDRSGTTSEIWSARDPLRLRIREANVESAYADGVITTRADGKVQTTRLDDAARRAIEDMDSSTSLTQPGRDPLAVVRRLLDEGALRPDGTAEVGGREVRRLVGSRPAPDAMGPAVQVEYLVDADSYAPVRLSTRATLEDGRPAGARTLTFLEYQRLPLTRANEPLLAIGG